MSPCRSIHRLASRQLAWLGLTLAVASTVCAQPSPSNIAPLVSPLRPNAALGVSAEDTRVRVAAFDFTGNTVFSSEVLRAGLAGWIGKSLNFGELVEVVETVETRYREAGYFLAQAYLPPQKIRDGSIEIAISEGQLQEVRLEGETRIRPETVYRYLDELPKGQALQLRTLERQVLLINDLAGGRSSLDLQAGENSGSTDVVLVQQPEPLLSGRLEANNHGLASTGVQRWGITLFAASPFDSGERLSLSVLTSEGRGLNNYNLRAEVPVGGNGWRVSAAASRAEYSLGGDFSALEASGTADSMRLGVSYPFVRSRTNNVRAQLEFDSNRLNDNFRSTNLQVAKESRGATATLSADWLSEGAFLESVRADLVLRSGQLDLGAAAASMDATPAGVDTAGRFNKAMLTLQALKSISRDVNLQTQLTWQIADRNLDASEKLSLGGPASIPGYATGEASGDAGVHAKLNLRWLATPDLVLTAFLDYAQLELSRVALPAAPGNDRTLRDRGLAADWQIGKHFTASVSAAWAEGDAYRSWLTVGYVW